MASTIDIPALRARSLELLEENIDAVAEMVYFVETPPTRDEAYQALRSIFTISPDELDALINTVLDDGAFEWSS